MSNIAQNIASVRQHLPQDVTLVCVSKFHPDEAILEAYAVGERDFGESRVQELLPKYESLPKDIRWHFIGHLQTNKVRAIIPFVYLIQSVDSLHLLDTINREAERIQRHVKVLLEVHVASEESKTGFLPADLPVTPADYPWVEICGVMGMATQTDDTREIRRCFHAIKEVGNKQPLSQSNECQPIISMGMSHDYRLAIEEGSTLVRVGTTIFGERQYATKPIAEQTIIPAENQVIILDMGGVLMQHNMAGCMARFRELMSEEAITRILGLSSNGEGNHNSIMEQFERGEITAERFVNSLLQYANPGTTAQDIIGAWNLMHRGIPEERIALLHQWHAMGYHLFLLSNNNELHWQDICSHYDLSIFEHCFVSHLLHLSKPDRRIYEVVQTYLTEHGYKAPFIFVDDITENRQAGEALGWLTYPNVEMLASHLQK